MRNRVVLIVGLVAAVGLVTPAGALAAPVSPVVCGATLTSDAQLKRDLRCPEGNGLTLVGNVTLDLRGHRLIGPGSGDEAPPSVGVSLSQTGTSTIVNGRIERWGTAIASGTSPEERLVAEVRDVRLVGNATGIGVERTDLTVRRVSVRGSRSNGIGGFDASVIRVSRSVFTGNGTGASNSFNGLLAVTGSILTGNRVGVDCSEVTCTVSGSRIIGSDRGVYSWFSGADVGHNVFTGNRIAFTAGYNPGAAVNGDQVHDNRFTGNDQAVTMEALASATIRNNLFTANRVGFSLPTPDLPEGDALLEGNRFVRNVDGVFATLPGVALRRNTAVRNTGWGIYAPLGTDLGGNTARGNGNQPQCVGVAC